MGGRRPDVVLDSLAEWSRGRCCVGLARNRVSGPHPGAFPPWKEGGKIPLKLRDPLQPSFAALISTGFAMQSYCHRPDEQAQTLFSLLFGRFGESCDGIALRLARPKLHGK